MHDTNDERYEPSSRPNEPLTSEDLPLSASSREQQEVAKSGAATVEAKVI